MGMISFIPRLGGGRGMEKRKALQRLYVIFSFVDSLGNTPSRYSRPNRKVEPLLKHMQTEKKKAVFLGRDISCDGQTITFQFRHRDKQRITYKKKDMDF